MSFTQVVWADFSSTPLFQLRAAIGDLVEMRGPLPGGDNLQDEELQLFIEQEANLGRAQARAVLTLQSRWAAYAQTLTTKSKTEAFKQENAYARLYTQLITRFGAPTMGAAEVDAGTPTNELPPIVGTGNVTTEVVINA